jgi:hypothetical protein
MSGHHNETSIWGRVAFESSGSNNDTSKVGIIEGRIIFIIRDRRSFSSISPFSQTVSRNFESTFAWQTTIFPVLDAVNRTASAVMQFNALSGSGSNTESLRKVLLDIELDIVAS